MASVGQVRNKVRNYINNTVYFFLAKKTQHCSDHKAEHCSVNLNNLNGIIRLNQCHRSLVVNYIETAGTIHGDELTTDMEAESIHGDAWTGLNDMGKTVEEKELFDCFLGEVIARTERSVGEEIHLLHLFITLLSRPFGCLFCRD